MTRVLELWPGLLGLTVIVATVIIVVSGGDDSNNGSARPTSEPTESPSREAARSHTMTAQAAAGLRARLVDNDWLCSQDLDRPVLLGRCDLWHGPEDNPTVATLWMLYADSGDLAEVVLSVRDGSAAGDEILQSTTPLVAGELLPDGDTHALRELATDARSEIPSDQIGGLEARRLGGLYDQVRLADPNHDPTDLWQRLDQGEPKPLPDAQSVPAALHDHGFECETSEDVQIACVSETQGLRVRVSASTDAHGPTKWTLYGKPTHIDGSVTVADATAALARTARTAGLTDDEGAAFIRERPQSQQQAAFHGYHVEMTKTGNSSERLRGTDFLAVQISELSLAR